MCKEPQGGKFLNANRDNGGTKDTLISVPICALRGGGGGGQVSASLSRHNLSHHFYHGSHYCRLSMRQCPPCPQIFSSEVTVI